MSRISRVGEIAFGLHEQLVEAAFRVPFHGTDRNALAAEARFGQRNEETLQRRLLRRKIRQSAVDDLCAGKREVRG